MQQVGGVGRTLLATRSALVIQALAAPFQFEAQVCQIERHGFSLGRPSGERSCGLRW
jgi:hypothetical protein